LGIVLILTEEEMNNAEGKSLEDLKQEGRVVEISEEKINIPDSLGEKIVGITFNPSGDDKVGSAKRACAYLIDLLDNNRAEHEKNGTLDDTRKMLIDHAMMEVLNAQMNVVKVITFK
jgi:hypothetical protein